MEPDEITWESHMLVLLLMRYKYDSIFEEASAVSFFLKHYTKISKFRMGYLQYSVQPFSQNHVDHCLFIHTRTKWGISWCSFLCSPSSHLPPCLTAHWVSLPLFCLSKDPLSVPYLFRSPRADSCYPQSLLTHAWCPLKKQLGNPNVKYMKCLEAENEDGVTMRTNAQTGCLVSWPHDLPAFEDVRQDLTYECELRWLGASFSYVFISYLSIKNSTQGS